MHNCYCDSRKIYQDCCGAFIDNIKIPKTPEELMRSRYAAYAQANIDYIIQTMKSPASDDFDAESAREWASQVNWLGLDVINTSQDGVRGIVEFIAHYSMNGKKNKIHEVSEFHLDNGKWFYVSGIEPKSKKIGRNDICPCGSQKKYKKCCGI